MFVETMVFWSLIIPKLNIFPMKALLWKEILHLCLLTWQSYTNASILPSKFQICSNKFVLWGSLLSEVFLSHVLSQLSAQGSVGQWALGRRVRRLQTGLPKISTSPLLRDHCLCANKCSAAQASYSSHWPQLPTYYMLLEEASWELNEAKPGKRDTIACSRNTFSKLGPTKNFAPTRRALSHIK